MENNKPKIKKFTDLIAWQKGHALVIETYKITSNFPKKETYSLIDQMRRCVVSITSNIAEGFNRQSSKEKVQFYFIALSSLTELQNQLLVARDVGYLESQTFQRLADQTIAISKLINGLIKSIRKNK